MIRQVTIRNFKSIRDLTVDLSPVTVLVGRSGSGKSTFLQAIQFVRDFVRANGQGDVIPSMYKPFANEYSPKATAEFGFQIELPSTGNQLGYFIQISAPNKQQVFLKSELLSFDGQTVFEQGVAEESGKPSRHIWKTSPPLTAVPKPGNLALGRLPGLEEASIAYSVLATGIGVHRFPLNVMQSASDDGLTQLDRNHQKFGLDDIGHNYLSSLQTLAMRVDQVLARRTLLATIQKLNRTVRSIELESLQELRGAIVGHELGNRIMPLRLEEESDGFRRIFAHLLALYQQPPKQTLLFEEPENGIFPGALELLGEEFRAAPAAGRGQVILTTHSPRLLDQFDAEQIRVVELNSELETVIGPLAADQREAIQDHLLSPGELLDVDPARRETVES